MPFLTSHLASYQMATFKILLTSSMNLQIQPVLTNWLLLQHHFCFLGEDFGCSCSCCCILSHTFFSLVSLEETKWFRSSSPIKEKSSQGSLGNSPQLFNHCPSLILVVIEILVVPRYIAFISLRSFRMVNSGFFSNHTAYCSDKQKRK